MTFYILVTIVLCGISFIAGMVRMDNLRDKEAREDKKAEKRK
jgi:hypothetical protein